MMNGGGPKIKSSTYVQHGLLLPVKRLELGISGSDIGRGREKVLCHAIFGPDLVLQPVGTSCPWNNLHNVFELLDVL